MTRPSYVFVGDDFTGASDTLATLARRGLRTRLYTRMPEALPDNLDAMGIATELRALAPGEARALLNTLAPRIAAIGARINHLKICSTFDSAPETGNVAMVADVLADALDADLVAIVGGQPSLKRYCLYGTLFAGASDGAIHRIDRHPVMKNHPITPIAEADLRRHLARQGWDEIGLVDYRVYAEGAEALRDEILRRLKAGERRILFDVATQDDLAVLGRALWEIAGEKRILCVGASSIAEAMLPFARQEKTAAVSQRGHPPIEGPVLVLSASRSPATTTTTQIEATMNYDKTIAPASDFMPGSPAFAGLPGRCAELLKAGRNVLVAVAAGTDGAITGRDVSRALTGFAADLVCRARPGCLVVAGGDTSSAVVAGLNVEALEFVRDIDPGVSMVCAVGGAADGLPMVLKGGQMGARDLFDRLQQPSAVMNHALVAAKH